MANLNDHKDRAHALLSASSAYRWMACPPSAVAATLYPDTSTEYADEGTLAHEIAEAVASAALSDHDFGDVFEEGVTQEMLDCAQTYSDFIQEHITSKDATVLLEQKVSFGSYIPDGFGTCDCLILQGDTLTVIDYKYGKGVPVSAVANPQLRLYALGALLDFGIAYDVKKVACYIFQPRMNNISGDEISAEDLLAWAKTEVKPKARLAAAGKGKHHPGEHCRFCPHAGRCRSLALACREYADVNGTRRKVEVLQPWEIADILREEPVISLWLKHVKEQALSDLLNGHEIPGYKVVEGRCSRSWADDLEIHRDLLAAGYTDEQITKTELLSPAAMEKALGKKVKDLLAPHILVTPGSPTIAPETDKRPKYDRLAEAKEDFA